MKISISPLTPNRVGISPKAAYSGPDKGLIRAWEAGRELADSHPQLVKQALAGELPELPFQRGFSVPAETDKKRESKLENLRKTIVNGKKVQRYGALHYFAMLCGLKGEGLELNTDESVEVQCARYGPIVNYTMDSSLYIKR
jgi:hypothetical protein